MANWSISVKTGLQLFGLTFLSGIMMYFGWPNHGWFPLIFTGLIPLFFAIDQVAQSLVRWRIPVVFLLVVLGHIIWIGGSTNWLHVTSPKTYYTGIFLESVVLGIFLSPSVYVTQKLGEKWGWFYLIVAWMSVEWLNQHWMAGTPFHSLGFGLGMHPWLIQSYEIIGVEGASLCILLVNLSLFLLIRQIRKGTIQRGSLILLGAVLLPFLISPLLDPDQDSEGGTKVKVSVLHSYMETYSDETHRYPEKVVEKLWGLSKSKELTSSDLLVWPETIVSNLGWLNNISGEKAYKAVTEGLKDYPDLSICLGGYGFSVVNDGENDPYAVKEETRGFYYTSHNVALTLDNSGRWPIRSKEVFIPFQERIPLLKQFSFMKEFADVVGANTMVSYYEYGDNIHKTAKGNRFVPVLCYESIYPVRMALNAAESDLAIILANEYWNKDLNGSEQYLFSNNCIAVQSRIPIFRSSNSGISAAIDKSGRVVERRKGADEGLVTVELPMKSELTIYEGIAGLMYKLSVLLMAGILFLAMIRRFFN